MSELCPTCKKPFNKRRKRFIETGSYGVVGRPRKADYSLIYKLRDEGNSLLGIHNKTGFNRGAIQHALKIRSQRDE